MTDQQGAEGSPLGSPLDATDEVVPRPSGLAWRTLKNSVYGMIEFGWPILVALVASPYIVNRLGADAYGVLSVVGVTLGFFGVLDLGIGSAAIRQIAAAHARADSDEINRVMSTTVVFYIVVGGTAALALIVGARPLATRVLQIPAGMQSVAVFAIYLSAVGFVLSLVTSALAAVPRALQRYDLTTKFNVAFGTLNTLATIVILALGKGLGWVMVAGFVIGILMVPVAYVMSKRLLPEFRVTFRFDKSTFLILFSFGGFYVLSTVGVLVLYQADKLLIGSLIGVAAVTYYVVPGNLASKIQGLVGAATAVVFPVSSSLLESGRHDAISRLYREGTRLVLLVSTAISVPMAVYARPFLLHWMGPRIAAQSGAVMIMLVATYYLLSLTSMGWGITNGSGKAWINAVFSIGIAVANIALFFALEEAWGVNGAAAAYLISALIGVPALIVYTERRVLGLSGATLVEIGWRIWLVGAVQGVVAYFTLPLAHGLMLTLLLMAGSVVLFLGLYIGLRFVQPGDRELIGLLVARVRPSART